MKALNIMIMTISGILIVSSVEARDHGSWKERGSEGRQQEEEIIIIKKKTYSDPPHSHRESHHHREYERSHRIHRHLPPGYRRFRVRDKHYYYHGGFYYQSCRGGYEIVNAPHVRHLPRRSRKVYINHTVYYVYDNVYYRHYNDYYVVCEPPPPPPPSRHHRHHRHKDKDATVQFKLDIEVK